MKISAKKVWNLGAFLVVLGIFIDLFFINPIQIKSDGPDFSTGRDSDFDIVNQMDRGIIEGSHQSVGSLEHGGDVLLEKTIRPTEEEGVFEVELNVKGANVKTPIYVTVVFDRSGSMICKDALPTVPLFADPHYTAADGTKLVCGFSKDNLTQAKWENAIKGTQAFTNEILNENEESRVSLITFADFHSIDVDWTHNPLQDADFRHPMGTTALGDALSDAIKQFDNVRSDALKVILIVGDGSPNNENTAKTQAQNAKDKGIVVYALGYHLDEEAGARELFQTLVSDPYQDHLYDTTSDNIEESGRRLATVLTQDVAGRRATITDELGEGFEYVAGSANVTPTIEGNKLSFQASNITESGTSYTFKIRINKDIETNWHETNGKASITYTDANGQAQTLEIAESAKVYWTQEKYPYSINYYKEGNPNTLITQETNEATLGTLITEDQVDPNKYQPEKGYQTGILQTKLPYSIIDGDNHIDIVYPRRTDYFYTVKYIEKETNTELDSIIKTNRTFDETYTEEAIDIKGYIPIGNTEETILVDDENKEITFYYQKKMDLTYKVNYYLDNTDGTLLGTEEVKDKAFLEKIYNEAIDKNKYRPEKGYQEGEIVTNMPYTIQDDENIIEVVYPKRTDLTYTVNYVDMDTDEVLETIVRDQNTFQEKYTEEAPTIKGYQLMGDPTQIVLIEDEDQVVTFYYQKKKDLTYTVTYYQDKVDGTLLGQVVVKNVTYLDQITNEDIEINKFKPSTGYQDGRIETTMPYQIDDDTNEIVVVYRKLDNLSYIVEYYQEDQKISKDEENIYWDQVFGNKIEEKDIDVNKYKPEEGYQDGKIVTSMPYTIQNDNNIIKVVYEPIRILNPSTFDNIITYCIIFVLSLITFAGIIIYMRMDMKKD